jgi:gliding motility-associated-like protein
MKILVLLLSICISSFTYAQLVVGTTYTTPTCHGYQNATASAIAIGGTPPYTYLWSTGDTTPSINNLSAGSYNITVYDDTISVSQSITIPQPEALSIIIDSTINSDYFPLNNGNIYITASGGTPPYTYLWQDSLFKQYGTAFGQEYNTQDITNVRGIPHYVHITDINGCYKDDTINLAEMQGMVVNKIIQDSACFSASATSTFTPTITNVPAQIVVSTQDTINIVAILAGGLLVTSDQDTIISYSNSFPPGINWIKIYSNNGVGWQYIWNVDSPKNPITIDYTHTGINCFGDSTGKISFTAKGGYGNFTYQISGPFWTTNTSYINNARAGIYGLIATDQEGCKAKQSVEIIQPTLLQGHLSIQEKILCHGENTGSIIANIYGGTGKYTYSWSNGESSQKIQNLQANIYKVIIQDSLNCQFGDSILLTQPNPLIITETSHKNASYYDVEDGQIIASIQGGTLPYTNYWQKDNEFYEYGDSILTNIGTGTYLLEIKDHHGCIDSLKVYIDYTNAPLKPILYEAFSPNGDGINDTYIIRPEYLIDNPKIDIYTVENHHIFKATTYTTPWDGMFQDKLLPAGKYILILQYPSGKYIVQEVTLQTKQ